MKLSIPDFSSARVLVIGDAMLDRYWHGAASRISPEAPVPVIQVGEVEERPGGAGNVALNIAALGGSVSVVGLTGDDDAAVSLRTHLTRANVRCRFVVVPNSSTVTKLRVISRHQQLIRLDFEDGFANVDQRALWEAYERALAEVDLVILSDYGKGALREAARLIDRAKREGKPVLVDPKGADFRPYGQATAITPNQTEFEQVAGRCSSERDLAERGQAMLNHLSLRALLITRSEKGMLLLRGDKEPVNFPARARDVFDVTGAGDTVIGVLGAALAAGMDFPGATALANLAAGIVVGKLGAATVSARELDDALHAHAPTKRGIIPEPGLVALVDKARARGERVVMTNGCFDILHAGHVAYLAEAAQLGDRLIVAVNDDASVRRLKGPDRPINSLVQRMAVLAGLQSVDWVVPFGEDTPQRIIEALAPAVLVKGGDYRPEDIAGAETVGKLGGEVAVLPYIDGCSTSAIIDAIRKHV